MRKPRWECQALQPLETGHWKLELRYVGNQLTGQHTGRTRHVTGRFQLVPKTMHSPMNVAIAINGKIGRPDGQFFDFRLTAITHLSSFRYAIFHVKQNIDGIPFWRIPVKVA